MTVARADTNRRPDRFIAESTQAVVPPRVARGDLTKADGDRLTAVIPRVLEATDAFDAKARQAKETLLPAKLPEALQREGEKALAVIDVVAQPHLDDFARALNTEEYAARPKLPDPLTPELREQLGRLLDRLEKEIPQRCRSLIRESGVKGDDQPWLCYQLLAPALIRDEVLTEQLLAQLTEIWLDRRPAGKARRDSARMAAGLLENVVYAARSFVASTMPAPPQPDLRSGSGRFVPRG